MTRRERIVVLLENYMDVENGLQEGTSFANDPIHLMCRAWNHPSYVELRRCVYALRDSEPVPYWNLAETYFRAPSVRMAACPRCDRTMPAKHVGSLHKHGPKTFALIPRMVKRVSLAVRPELVSQAIDWIEREYEGDVFVPDDLLATAA